ncbi:hypothetical protein [Wolbachia endosymbiont of Cardiocondyla obscurior]|uniref:hypothetical protein n=1 Tax=Wolbachia endosymbiont of Cardiocondyla obscurior TaxID=2687307 RepID=UPI00157A2256|nr:hypothetical protein [Wolbachia endosymbiont of Cardiocondyla obscurior]
MLAAEIPRMNRGMTVRDGVTISSLSRCLLAAKRYRGSMTVKWGVIPVSATRMTGEGGYLHDTILFSGSK